MPWPVHPNGLLGAQGDNDNYQISRSLRFNSADSAFLNRTFPVIGNASTWTFSFWIKPSSSAGGNIFSSAQTLNTNNVLGQIYFTSGRLGFFQFSVSTTFTDIITSQVFRDFSAWYHVVVRYDDTQATASNRVRMYVNGSLVTAFSSASYPSQNLSGFFNQNQPHLIGQYAGSGQGEFISGYLAEIHFVTGQSLDSSSFGETDAVTGRWKAKAYSGSYGANGFYLKFADNSSTAALGTDSSGNGNTWTVNNFSVTAGADNDSLVDSPTNYGSDSGVGGTVRGNYCTMNPLSNNGGTMVDGNLDFYGPSAWRFAGGTIAVSYGKWYIEATHFGASVGNTEGNTYSFIGFIKPSTLVSAGLSHTSYTSSVIGIGDSGWAYNFASGSSVTTGFGSGDIASVSIDFTTGSYDIRKNNTSIASGTMAFTGELIPAIFSYESTYRWQPNFGQRPFAYTAPSGFKSLCTTNLTTPTIKKPSSYFDSVAYTGTGASNSISSLGFSPDLVWIKNRGGATSHALYDTVRGVQAQLSSDTTGSEVTSSTGLTAFGSNGFTIGTSTLVNTSGTQYVAWAWDAGESSVTNNSGSITSTVRANPQNGVSVVSATMPNLSSPQTVGHGLGVAPKMIIAKFRSAASNWNTYHSSLGATKIIFLNSTDASVSDVTRWNNTEPTSSVFTLGSAFVPDASSNTLITYCFAEIEGFSKFGSYTGNGSADGPFVYCGFRPRYLLVKRTDSAFDWVVFDSARSTFNEAQASLFPNANSAEYSGGLVDFDLISNGFKARDGHPYINASGGTYIFAAFAEQPFKYARAR
jgi:hypothetical protein